MKKTHDIIMSVVTHAHVHDAEAFNGLIPRGDRCDVEQITGDGAYDTQHCWPLTTSIGARPCFPPRAGAARHKPTDERKRLRNHAIEQVRKIGLKKWKEKNNYHRRSISETAFMRLKKIFGASAASKTFENQVTELTLRCHMLNKMNQLGMPDSVMV